MTKIWADLSSTYISRPARNASFEPPPLLIHSPLSLHFSQGTNWLPSLGMVEEGVFLPGETLQFELRGPMAVHGVLQTISARQAKKLSLGPIWWWGKGAG